MSLPEISLYSAVKRQYLISMHTIGVSFYRNLILLEIFMIILSLLTAVSYGLSSYAPAYTLTIREMDTDFVLWGAALYACLMTTVLAGTRFGNISFTLAGNRASHQLSTMAVVVTFCALAAVIGTLSMVLARVIIALGGSHVLWNGFRLSPGELLICAVSVFGYGLLASGAVYLLTTIGRRSRKALAALLALLLLAAVLGLNFCSTGVETLVEIYFLESSPLLFLLKALASAGICFAAAYALGRRLEVRR